MTAEHQHKNIEMSQKYIINELHLIIEDNLTNAYREELEEIESSKLSFLKGKRKAELEKLVQWHDNTYRKMLLEENEKIESLTDASIIESYRKNNAIAICKGNDPYTIMPINYMDKDGNKSIYLWKMGYEYMIYFAQAFGERGYHIEDCSVNYYNEIHLNVHENHDKLIAFMNQNDANKLLEYCIVKHCEILSISFMNDEGKRFTMYRDGYLFDDSLSGELCSEALSDITRVTESRLVI